MASAAVGFVAAARGPTGVGWGMALALHTIRPTRGSNREAGEVPALSFMRRMSLCPRISHGKAWGTGKGPELGLCLKMNALCECAADLKTD